MLMYAQLSHNTSKGEGKSLSTCYSIAYDMSRPVFFGRLN